MCVCKGELGSEGVCKGEVVSEGTWREVVSVCVLPPSMCPHYPPGVCKGEVGSEGGVCVKGKV